MDSVHKEKSEQCRAWPAASSRADARAGHTPIDRAVVYDTAAVGPCS